MKANSNLDLSSSEKGIIQGHGRVDGVFIGKLDVCEAFRVTVELVAQNRDSLDSATTVKVLFEFFRCRGIIDIANINGPKIEARNMKSSSI